MVQTIIFGIYVRLFRFLGCKTVLMEGGKGMSSCRHVVERVGGKKDNGSIMDIYIRKE